MYDQPGSIQKDKKQSITQSIAGQQNTHSVFQFKDTSAEGSMQQRLQAVADGSALVKQQGQLKAMAENGDAKERAVQRKANNTGLPDQLKGGIEGLSGYSMDDVKVHFNSARPAQLNAHAYAQGTDIHLAPGQEKHLPHEAWHVVQQKQGRVKPTMQMQGGVQVNDDEGLEKEADVMGGRALQRIALSDAATITSMPLQFQVVQRARTIDKILNFVDQNSEALGECGGAHMRRLMYWNDQGFFDTDKGGILNLKTVRKAMEKKIPDEIAPVDENKLPGFMRVRTNFGVRLPDYFGGGKLWFRKKPESVVFQGRAWISDNIYWHPDGGPKYMIHAILEWAGGISGESEPNPHITLRNAETQVKIDLDIANPLPEPRITAALEVTRASFSQGLGVDREPGMNMANDESTFDNLKAETTQAWLRELKAAAQEALFAELQPVDK